MNKNVYCVPLQNIKVKIKYFLYVFYGSTLYVPRVLRSVRLFARRDYFFLSIQKMSKYGFF